MVWENKTTPILTGNMMGIPKIYADIEDLHILADAYRTRLSFEGSTFLELEMTQLEPLDMEQVNAMNTDINTFGWRYIPKVGEPGADLSQPILFPMHNEAKAACLGSGKVKWTESTWDQNPMQFYIINALAELPIIEMKPAILMQGREILTEARGRVLK